MTIRPFERKDLKQCCDMARRQHAESLWSHLPYDGEKRWKETGKHGFVKPNGAWNSLIAEIMSLVISIQGKDDKTIHLYGWIENPSSDPSILNRQ